MVSLYSNRSGGHPETLCSTCLSDCCYLLKVKKEKAKGQEGFIHQEGKTLCLGGMEPRKEAVVSSGEDVVRKGL